VRDIPSHRCSAEQGDGADGCGNEYEIDQSAARWSGAAARSVIIALAGS